MTTTVLHDHTTSTSHASTSSVTRTLNSVEVDQLRQHSSGTALSSGGQSFGQDRTTAYVGRFDLRFELWALRNEPQWPHALTSTRAEEYKSPCWTKRVSRLTENIHTRLQQGIARATELATPTSSCPPTLSEPVVPSLTDFDFFYPSPWTDAYGGRQPEDPAPKPQPAVDSSV